MEAILGKTEFFRLRSFTLTGSPVPGEIVCQFVTRHRKTLREVNIHFWPESTVLGNLQEIVLILKGLSGDLEDFEYELEKRQVHFFREGPRWKQYLVTGFGCVFRDREGCEKKDLVELGLLLPLNLQTNGDGLSELNTFFKPEELHSMFKENIFRNLERLCLILPPQVASEATVEGYMASHLLISNPYGCIGIDV